MKKILIILALPFLICSCSETGEAEKPVNPETAPAKADDGTEVELDTL